jgi:hypothetical protein
MAKGNKKGPQNTGPKTGRGKGFCAGHDEPGCMDSSEEHGNGSSRGGGFGCRHGNGHEGQGHCHEHHANGRPGWQRSELDMPHCETGGHDEPSREEELEFLKEQALRYEEGLNEIRRRMDAMEKGK